LENHHLLEKNQAVAPWEYHHRWLGYLREKGLVLDKSKCCEDDACTSSTAALLLLDSHSGSKLVRAVRKDAASGSSLETRTGAKAVEIGTAREIRTLVYSTMRGYSHRRAATCGEGLLSAVQETLRNVLGECQGGSREEGSDKCETCNHGVFLCTSAFK
jgi:hypothetical protein